MGNGNNGSKGGNLLSRVAYSFGNVGQSAFYNALSTYFIVYVTSSLFSGVDKSVATKLIGIITGLVVVIRIAEIFIDPLLGNIIDNTTTKWGRFRPWQFLAGAISSVLIVLVYTGLFGLVNVNTTWFIVLFVITFIVLDVFYSLRDISYWGMIPALSSDSHERSTYTALGSFGGSIGYNGLTIVVIPIVTYFSWVFTGADGSQQRATVFDFEGAGVLQGQYNKDDSIRSFARSCFNYALDVKQDLWFGAKDTISKKYDHTFKDIFQETYDAEYKEKFEAAGITYFYSLIDDIVARVIRSEGGFVWACKNYDGDVMSDMVSTAFGSLAMMTSVLVSPDGKYEYEAAHGTVTRHYYKYLKGEKTSTNPMATIFAWSGALKKRGELDNLPELVHFGEALEAASLQTLNEGIMTKDLCGLAEGITPTAVDSEGFIKAIRERLEAKLA